jgi:small subunit ribosomal protein S1
VIVSQTLDASGAKRFAPGTVHEGVVRRITPFGVFVELEKRVVGLLHVSHASHGHVDDLHSIFAVGDRIKCMAIKMKSRARLKSVSLSTKFLEPTPGDMLVNPAMVYEKAEETAKLFMEEKRAQRKSKHAAKERETLTPVA